MERTDALVGARVRSLRDFSGVDEGTEGVIDEDYGSGVVVAWDLEDRPLPEGYPENVDDPRIRGKVLTTGPDGFETPILRDGFSCDPVPALDLAHGELDFLELVEEAPS